MNNEFICDLLKKMDEAKPPKIDVNLILSDDFIKKHTKFTSFQEMVKLAVKESGLIEEYLENLKEKIK